MKDFREKLRVEKLEEYKPTIIRGHVDFPPRLSSMRFQFEDVPISIVQGKYINYLLDGTNKESFLEDLIIINSFAIEAKKIKPDLPDFFINESDICFMVSVKRAQKRARRKRTPRCEVVLR